MRIRDFNRWQAFGWHFSLSTLLGLAIFLLFRYLWYPGALWDLSGAGKLLLLVVGVDVTLGPLLTLIVFNPKKKSLPLDLAAIVLVQTAALAYGVWVMAQSRPVFLVGVVDRIEIVSASELDPASLGKARPEYQQLSWTGPILIGSVTDLPGNDRFQITMDALSGGADVHQLADHYVPFAQVADVIAARGLSLTDLKARASEPSVVSLAARMGDHSFSQKARAVALRGRTGFGTAIIESDHIVATTVDDIW